MAAQAAPSHLMDRIYRRQRHVYDLTRKYYLFGRDRLIDELCPRPDGAVLEIGCGTGRNLILAARRYPDARFFGLDVSEAMLETARAAIERRGLGGRIILARGDAATFDGAACFGQPRFDRIILSYSLSMIPAWQDVLARAIAALTPEGRLSIVDFGEQEGFSRLPRHALRRWLARFHVEPRPGIAEEARAAAGARGLLVDEARLYRGYAVYVVVRPPLLP